MIVKLLIEHHLEFLRLTGGCTGSSESTCQNTILLEITCHDSFVYGLSMDITRFHIVFHRHNAIS